MVTRRRESRRLGEVGASRDRGGDLRHGRRLTDSEPVNFDALARLLARYRHPLGRSVASSALLLRSLRGGLVQDTARDHL